MCRRSLDVGGHHETRIGKGELEPPPEGKLFPAGDVRREIDPVGARDAKCARAHRAESSPGRHLGQQPVRLRDRTVEVALRRVGGTDRNGDFAESVAGVVDDGERDLAPAEVDSEHHRSCQRVPPSQYGRRDR